jgi:DNA-directed RNA polymerase subunit RPC12/RpoP
MSKCYYQCNYCGTEFVAEEKVYYWQEVRCPKCNDKSLNNITHKIGKVDIYSDQKQKDAWIKK